MAFADKETFCDADTDANKIHQDRISEIYHRSYKTHPLVTMRIACVPVPIHIAKTQKRRSQYAFRARVIRTTTTQFHHNYVDMENRQAKTQGREQSQSNCQECAK